MYTRIIDYNIFFQIYHWEKEGGGGGGKKSSVDDMVLLTKINEAAITENLKKRFMFIRCVTSQWFGVTSWVCILRGLYINF